jgi:hypothetical protein
MFESSDDTKVRRPRRVEVFTGPERRRDWPDDRKLVNRWPQSRINDLMPWTYAKIPA